MFSCDWYSWHQTQAKQKTELIYLQDQSSYESRSTHRVEYRLELEHNPAKVHKKDPGEQCEMGVIWTHLTDKSRNDSIDNLYRDVHHTMCSTLD